MRPDDITELEVSGWWGVAAIVLMAGGGAMLVANRLGTQASDLLMYYSLIGLFLAGGILLGLLSLQAAGASQHWDLGHSEDANQEAAAAKSAGSSATLPINSSAEHETDPVLEILHRHQSQRAA